ncbi:MAG: hypothetical protein ACFFDY_01035 [Candidatus Thorarchaeota archaeon]
MSFQHDPLNTVVGVFANKETGNPDYIVIGGFEFDGPQGAVLATSKLLPGLNINPNTPYGIFQPNGIIEVTAKENITNFKRFYFDTIDYLNDCYDKIILELGRRFNELVAWRQIVLNQ